MPRFRLRDDSIYCVRWDGDYETANDLVGDDYGVDWEYIDEDSLDIRIFVNGAAYASNVKSETGSSSARRSPTTSRSISRSMFTSPISSRSTSSPTTGRCGDRPCNLHDPVKAGWTREVKVE